MVIAITFLNLELLVKVASTLLIILYMFVNLAVIIMRESKIQNYQPKFHSPLYPWLQIIGIFAGGFLIFEMVPSVLMLASLLTMIVAVSSPSNRAMFFRRR